MRGVASFARRVRALARRVDLYDGCGAAGAGLLCYGTAQIYRPAAFVLAGLLLLGVALVPVLRRKRGG